MVQYVMGMYSGNPADNTYQTLADSSPAWLSIIGRRSLPIPTGLTISNLYMTLTVAPGGTTIRRFTVYKNGSPTSLLVEFTGSEVTQEDTSNTVSFSAGDLVSLRYDTISGTPAALGVARWSTLFTMDTANETVVFSQLTGGRTADTYLSYIGSVNDNGTTYAVAAAPIPTNGTFKNLHAYVENAPAGTDVWDVTLHDQDGATSLTCQITSGGGKQASDLVNTADVVAGDTGAMFWDETGTPATTRLFASMVFVPDTNGESILGSHDTNILSPTATEFHSLSQWNTWGTASPARLYVSGGAFTVKKLYCILDGIPTNTYDISIRRNLTTNDVTVQLSGSETADNNTADEGSYTQGDTIIMQSDPTSSPTARALGWAFVQYNAPSGWGHTINSVDTPDKVDSISGADIDKINSVQA